MQKKSFDYQYTNISAFVNEELKQYFRPEFLNCLDEIHRLPATDQGMKSNNPSTRSFFLNRLTSTTVEVTARFNDRLVEEGYNPSYERVLSGGQLRARRLPCRGNPKWSCVKDGDTVIDVDDDGQTKSGKDQRHHCPQLLLWRFHASIPGSNARDAFETNVRRISNRHLIWLLMPVSLDAVKNNLFRSAYQQRTPGVIIIALASATFTTADLDNRASVSCICTSQIQE